ncbi:MAG: hypothetical protein EXS68_00720 [Candidatus Ryanbacteria bacterium]|nr:hypothetical protein [Candidatus Ryanbacteria bacterium]
MGDLKSAIASASAVLIVLPDSVRDKDYLAALQIQKIAPQKTELIAPEAKELEWKDTFGLERGKREFVIDINTALTPVDELRYEKTDTTLSIYLSHKGAFNEKALSWGEHRAPADLFITLGFSSESEAKKAIENLPRKGAARHIWVEGDTNGHSAPATTKLSTISAGLLGRLVVRSRIDTDTNTLWSFITRDDFAKTNAGPHELPSLMATYASLASLPEHALVFWQHDDAGTQGFFRSENAQLVNDIARHLGKMPENPHYVTLASFANFIEAEMETRKLLRELKVR